MNISKGKLILLAAIPFVIVLAWGIITNANLSAARSDLKQSQLTLTQTQNELTDTKQQLTDAKTQLTTTQNTLTQTQTTLTQTQTQLDTTKTELTGTKTQLTTTQNQLTTTQNQLTGANADLATAKTQLSDAQTQLATAQTLLADYKKTMQALGIAVHSNTTTWNFNGLSWAHNDSSQAVNPTWAQLTAFIAQDTTDQHVYNIKTYNCVNYATTVYNNAENLKIESATVTINLRNSSAGHAVNAFITSDYGLVYVDCTGSDAIARIQTGKVYRAAAPNVVSPAQVNNNSWWDGLRNYYYVTNDLGGEAVVNSIDIYW